MRLGRRGELIPVSGFSRGPETGLDMSTWVSHDGLRVTSGLHQTELPGSGTPPKIGPTWLVVVSRSPVPGGPRCTVTDDDLRRVIEGFAMPAHDEDNHHPGIARHLFCPVDEQYRNACECKFTETEVVEPNGYRWTTDDQDECRGCEYERRFGPLCTIHGGAIRSVTASSKEPSDGR